MPARDLRRLDARAHPGHIEFGSRAEEALRHDLKGAGLGVGGQLRRRAGPGADAHGERTAMRVVLVGVGCVGKTTIGQVLASRLDCPFFDLDEETTAAPV